MQVGSVYVQFIKEEHVADAFQNLCGRFVYMFSLDSHAHIHHMKIEINANQTWRFAHIAPTINLFAYMSSC